MKKININKSKSIGKVLYIVEGSKTEPFLLDHIFGKLFGYQIEMSLREKSYRKYRAKDNPLSRVFVINSEQSNIRYINEPNDYLDALFIELITEYDFDVDNAAIYYLFDRDDHSNNDTELIKGLIAKLKNSRSNPGYERQGMLLLSYPSVESFTLSNFMKSSFNKEFDTGKHLKQYLDANKINHRRIDEETLIIAANELIDALQLINECRYDLDDISECSNNIFDYEESYKRQNDVYKALSLLIISLLDLGLIEICE